MSIASALNRADRATARPWLENCCAADQWVQGMLAAWPFADDDQLLRLAGDVWWSLGEADWRQAFAAHARIGDVGSLRAKYAQTRKWAAGEQAGVEAASDETLQQLAAANDEYEQRFGFIFIVCATGKSADEMLGLLRSRLTNSPPEEIRLAAEQQLEITKLRLRKLAP